MKKGVLFFLLLIAAAIVQGFYYYPLMPENMASHFEGDGTPNGWQSKGAFYATYAGVLFMLAFSFLGTSLWISKIPPAMINLPNKTYWMHESRRQAAFGMYLDFMITFGSGTLILMISLMQLVFNYNRGGAENFSSTVWLFLIMYAAFVIVQTVVFMIRFRVPKGA